MTSAVPFMKWPGGKRALLPAILPLVPCEIATYYEPFVGGGAVFFALAAECRFRHAVIGDANLRLVRSYTAVRDNIDSVIVKLGIHAAAHCKDYFYEQRAIDIDAGTDAEVAAWMIYLNRTCFNGLYRVNRSGKFNVPFGDYKSPTICDPDRLRACSEALAGVEIVHGDFRETLPRNLVVSDFVYLDSPYVPISKTSNFTAYTGAKFGPADQDRLADRLRVLGARNIPALLSNADCPETRLLYAGLPIETVTARRNINSAAMKRGPVGELLVRSFEYAITRCKAA